MQATTAHSASKKKPETLLEQATRPELHETDQLQIEPSLLVSDKARDREGIRSLENENAKVVELERKNREFERMAMEFERRSKDLERKFYELEDAMYKAITKQSGCLTRQAGHVNKGGIAPHASLHEAAKTQSPDYERGNRDVN